MYSFIFMNVACLLTHTKRKNEVLSDLCDRSTLFLCLCETLLHEGILDSEIKISGFSIIRCDRMSRAGGGVCVYVSNSTTYDICLTYSNSVCELLSPLQKKYLEINLHSSIYFCDLTSIFYPVSRY